MECLSLDPIAPRHLPPAMRGDSQGVNFCRPVPVFQSAAVMLPNCDTNCPLTPQHPHKPEHSLPLPSRFPRARRALSVEAANQCTNIPPPLIRNCGCMIYMCKIVLLSHRSEDAARRFAMSNVASFHTKSAACGPARHCESSGTFAACAATHSEESIRTMLQATHTDERKNGEYCGPDQRHSRHPGPHHISIKARVSQGIRWRHELPRERASEASIPFRSDNDDVFASFWAGINCPLGQWVRKQKGQVQEAASFPAMLPFPGFVET